jgi:pSer/pThr/pTyr-binding forkhead associated (FHA) protein
MAVLRELTGPQEYPLRGKMTVIGRDPGCDIVVSAPQASGRHAMVVHSGGAYFVEDLDSVNGTYVNGVRIQQRTRLNPGDRIEIHGLRVAFHLDRMVHDDTQQTVLFRGTLPPFGERPAIVSSVDLARGVRAEIAPEAKLRAILEISKNLGNSLKLNEVLPKILESLFAIFRRPTADSSCCATSRPANSCPRRCATATAARRARRPSAAPSSTTPWPAARLCSVPTSPAASSSSRA